jgi:transaldolase
MTLLLDSALIVDARQAAALGFIRGATTNPSLMAKAGRAPELVIAELCEVLPGTIFYQLAAQNLAKREAEARRMVAMHPDRIGLKIPCTLENLALATRLVQDGFTVGLTAIFSSAQVYLACQAGVHYVLPYVNRSTRLLGDGFALVAEMREVIEAGSYPVEIVAASVKNPEEAVQTLLAGAHHLTLPLAVIQSMGQHPLSDEAIADFSKHTLLTGATPSGETQP